MNFENPTEPPFNHSHFGYPTVFVNPSLCMYVSRTDFNIFMMDVIKFEWNRIESNWFEGKRKLRRIEKQRSIFSAVETFMRIQRCRHYHHRHHHHVKLSDIINKSFGISLSLSWMSKRHRRILKCGKNGWKKMQFQRDASKTRIYICVAYSNKAYNIFIFGSACQTMARRQQQ